jgi:thiamine pyrophosphokinase
MADRPCELLRSLASEHDVIIAVDGAVHAAIAHGIKPHVVCGDFDSIDIDSAKKSLPTAEFLSLPDQDHTDLEKAIQLAYSRHASAITIAGAIGGRIDHTLASLTLLLHYHQDIPLRMVDDCFDLWVVSGPEDSFRSFSFSATRGDTISLLSFSARVCVTLLNVHWPLHEEILPIGTHGVSNVALGDTITVNVRSGPLVFCRLGHIKS